MRCCLVLGAGVQEPLELEARVERVREQRPSEGGEFARVRKRLCCVTSLTRAFPRIYRALALKALDARVTSSPVIGSTPSGSSGAGETGTSVAEASAGAKETSLAEDAGKDEASKA